MIKISNLSKSINDQKIVNNLSLEITKGTIFGFLGPNGAGKTTTMKMIVGLNSPDTGSVEIDGSDPVNIATRQKISYMPEDPYFYEHLSALEFLFFMRSLFDCHSDQRGGILNRDNDHQSNTRSLDSKNTARDDRKNDNHSSAQTTKAIEQLNNLLDMVGLKGVGKKKIKDFSKGMKQRLGLAQALVNDPNYLFLDEPLDGLDPIGRLEFKNILISLKNEGKTIFFNSHILSDVEEICDSIGIINKGKLIYEGPVKKFSGNKSLEQKFVEVIKNNA
jgi:ABC-2 type transport system ATP-binding protein